MDKTGRRSLISSFMIIGGTACIVAACIPQGNMIWNNFNTLFYVIIFKY